GLEIDVFAKRLSFFFNCHNNFFEEIAKFRAARRMWANITKELGAQDPKAQMLRFHTQTGGSTLTAQQPLNNIVRVTNQAMAAVLGGTQSLHTNGFDEALSLPTEAAAKIALRTQQIIAFESGATETVDPLAGSYFVEALTDQLEQEAWAYIQKIDVMGGSVAAIEQGYIQQEIADAAYKYQLEIEQSDRIIVGVNKFTQASEGLTETMNIDDSIRIMQSDKLKDLRAVRNNEKVTMALAELKGAAEGENNLMPHIVEAVECYATLGEICDTLRDVFGEY
ncbi:MAG: methylmalonyl-CoA mutase, partial [Sphingobacteriales bacterium]